MFIKTVIFFVLSTFFLTTIITAPIVSADVSPGDRCNPGGEKCIDGYYCNPAPSPPPDFLCQKSPILDVFGQIKPPTPLQKFIGKDPSGTVGISQFLTNLVVLIYSLAFIVLIFMILWGAWDWMTSEGDKEKLESAKKKLINAFVGMLIFAVAFAAIQVLGNFTGFKFFVGQRGV